MFLVHNLFVVRKADFKKAKPPRTGNSDRVVTAGSRTTLQLKAGLGHLSVKGQAVNTVSLLSHMVSAAVKYGPNLTNP